MNKSRRYWKEIDTWKEKTALGEFPIFMAFRLGVPYGVEWLKSYKKFPGEWEGNHRKERIGDRERTQILGINSESLSAP